MAERLTTPFDARATAEDVLGGTGRRLKRSGCCSNATARVAARCSRTSSAGWFRRASRRRPLDNAMAEALNGSFKAELIEHHGPWRDADQVERAVVQWTGTESIAMPSSGRRAGTR